MRLSTTKNGTTRPSSTKDFVWGYLSYATHLVYCQEYAEFYLHVIFVAQAQYYHLCRYLWSHLTLPNFYLWWSTFKAQHRSSQTFLRLPSINLHYATQNAAADTVKLQMTSNNHYYLIGILLSHMHACTHTHIPWILKFVMETIGCGISYKDTLHINKCR